MSQPRVFIVGSANIDLVMEVASAPLPGQTVAGGDLRYIPGGKGANQACSAAKMGASAFMVGQVGSDSFGELLLESLRLAGVETGRVGRHHGPTGCASIYVLPGGENCIVISPGANASLNPEIALSRLEDLTPADFVLLQLEIPLETVEAVLRYARRAGATTILDPAPARELPASLLQLVDYLTPNQTEASVLTGRPGEAIANLADAEAAGARLLASGGANVILKLGEAGCMLLNAGGCRHVPAHRVRAVDTTAAGDVFNGAFAAMLAVGETPEAAAAWANAAAAVSVTRPGAQPSIPVREEVALILGQATFA
jgi:ribokinase